MENSAASAIRPAESRCEDDRFNIYATSPEQPHPKVVFSTHMDTVPPFIPSSEDAARIYGRGSCDAKGIIAAQIAASERLRQQGVYVGLLFVVGEERDSQGAKVANEYAANQPAHRRKVPGEWRTDREPHRAGVEGNAAGGGHRFWAAWRIRLIRNLANPRSTN